MLNIEHYSAPELLGFPSLHMMIDEEYKNVGFFSDQVLTEDEATCD